MQAIAIHMFVKGPHIFRGKTFCGRSGTYLPSGLTSSWADVTCKLCLKRLEAQANG